MIFDSHTHAFPMAAIDDPGNWADRNGEPHWNRLVVTKDGSESLQGWVPLSEFSDFMDRDGINGAALLGWYWQNPDSCLLQNEETAAFMKTHGTRFRAFAAVHPAGPTPQEIVDWAVRNGFLGFGEILPAIQGSRLSDPFWMDLAGLAAEAGLIFNFHVTEPVGRPHRGRISTPFDEIQSFVEAHPDLPIILSHWGGGLFLHELNPYLRDRFRNVYYDASASPLLYNSEIFLIACQTVGSGKILFGSDFPLRLFPKDEKTPGWKRFLAEIRQLPLGEIDRKNILGENARRLFRLSS